MGGGSILVPHQLEGASEVLLPEHFGWQMPSAPAIAQVSGQIEKVFSLENTTREAALREAKELAVEEAISAGAAPESVEIIDIEYVPLAYLGSAVRIRVKAVGNLIA